MADQLSVSQEDPWADVSKPNTQPAFERDDSINELRGPMCGDNIRKLLASNKSPMRSARKSVSSSSSMSSRGSSTKNSAPEQQSLLEEIEESAESPFTRNLINGRRRLKGVGKSSEEEELLIEGRRARSPDGESAAASNENMSSKKNRKFFAEFFASVSSGRDGEGQEVAPYYVLELNRSSGSSDSQSPRKTKQDESSQDSRPSKTRLRSERPKNRSRRMPSRSAGSKRKSKSGSWTPPLPSVMEESSSAEDSNGQTTINHAKPEDAMKEQGEDMARDDEGTAQMMTDMKKLVQTQKNSIDDVMKENQKFREELAQYRELLTEAKKNRTSFQSEMERLAIEKKSSESETQLLREEMKLLKQEIAKMKEESKDSSSSKNKETSNVIILPKSKKDPDLAQFEEMKKAIYGNLLEVDSLLKSKSEESLSIEDSSLFLDDKPDDTTNTSTLFLEEKPDDTTAASSAISLSNSGDSRQRSFDSSRLSSTGSTSSFDLSRLLSARSLDEISKASAERSKEEVNLFKSRLEAIQKKREERKIREGGFGSRSGRVQFD